MQGWLRWLEATGLAVVIRDSAWLYPAVETIHIFGFTIVVGAAVMFDLRLLGMSASIRVTELAHHLLPWSRRSFLCLVFPSGALLFATQATHMAASPVFRLKLSLIALAGLNAFVFHARTMKGAAEWDQAVKTPLPAKVAAMTSLILWTGTITCGRMLAYF